MRMGVLDSLDPELGFSISYFLWIESMGIAN